MLPASSDIVVYARDRRPVLAVEIRETRQPSAKDAAALRGCLHAHGLVPASAFYLIVYPTTLFLWRRETPATDLPDYAASAKWAGDDTGAARVYKDGLQLVVFWWLSVLTNGLRDADPASEADKILIDSGVYEDLRHGEVRFEGDR